MSSFDWLSDDLRYAVRALATNARFTVLVAVTLALTIGATTTVFYMIDHDKDTLVTIADKTATGSSNTGGGKLQTVGNIVDQFGVAFNMSPTADFDIYTDSNGTNYLVGQSTRWLFSIDLSQIDPNLPVGRRQQVTAFRGAAAPVPGANAPLTGGVFDIAIPTR